MDSFIKDLIERGYLRTDSIINAFSDIKRIEFVPKDLADQAEADIPLPIGHGQTISQPLTVAFMLEILDLGQGQNVLDVGSGSGWTTGLLSHIVGEKGRVTALEVIKELCETGKKNVAKFGFVKKGIAEFYCESAENGFEKNAPYDRILVSAAADEIPLALKKQLSVGGKMAIPIKKDIWFVEKKGDEDFFIEKFSGFSFVPFVKSKQ
jgi:protein-L-isoaspartate(D-aspartate) O-methyltransferase